MIWKVTVAKKAMKRVRKLPLAQKQKLNLLVADLEGSGPIQPNWPNYSMLKENQYHCHLSRKWVACWEVIDNELRLIEIYYAGSREKAPYD